MFNRRIHKGWLIFLIIIFVLIAVYYFPLPYYVSAPGEAMELQPIIEVEGGYDEQGSFMLTTVKMGGANLISYAVAHFNEYMDLIDREEIMAHYEDEEDYTRHQLQVMESSQDSAILMAYSLADQHVEIHNEGVLVTHTVKGMPAHEHLQIGDKIREVDGEELQTSEALIDYISSKEAGDVVHMTFIRDDEEHEASIELTAFPGAEEGNAQGNTHMSPRAGVGIGTLTDRSIEVDPPVHIETERIGGPSAGLMFTLEIYNQLTEEDITKGYQIAGTGTIDSEGRVGPIGGIHQKIVAADDIGAEIFFAPHDEAALTQTNYERALEAASDIRTNMEIIPVQTVYDALDYMETLPEKENE